MHTVNLVYLCKSTVNLNGICSIIKITHTHISHLSQVFLPTVSRHRPPHFSEQLDVELHKRFWN